MIERNKRKRELDLKISKETQLEFSEKEIKFLNTVTHEME